MVIRLDLLPRRPEDAAANT